MDIPNVSLELIRKLDVAGPRYTSYPTVPVWSEGYNGDQYALALKAAGRSTEPLSLYVHVPFCEKMCSYCGCNVIVTHNMERVDGYLDALETEARLVAQELGAGRVVTRLHLGGGTPTFLDEARLERLLGIVEGAFTIAKDAERSLEINPAVTRPEQLELMRRHGFTRLSMGVQDFDRRVQEAVGRSQTVDETREMIDLARRIGFVSVNFDLIYGLPRQTVESFRRTLEIAASLGPDRLATFAFAYVPALKPHQRRLPMGEMPGPVDRVELLRTAQQVLGEAGYRTIGMDHFALPTDELAKAAEERRLGRDFQGYTVEHDALETVALGPSGISFVGGAYAQTVKSLGEYRAALEAGALPIERGITLSDEDHRRRALITRLMCNFELTLDADEVVHYARELEQLKTLEELVECRDNRVVITPLGRLFVRNVAMVFDAYLRPGGSQFSRAV